MAWHNTRALAERFKIHAASSRALDIAVAWAGPSLALEDLKDAARRVGKENVRLIIGTYGYSTHPGTLKDLLPIAQVKLVEDREKLFHPKLYIFKKNSETYFWVGSANFTRGGFSLNHELIYESKLRNESFGAQQWFEDSWNDLRDANENDVERYREKWEQRPRPKASERRPEGLDLPHHPINYFRNVRDWPEYFGALRSCDLYWRVKGKYHAILREEWSYGHTINVLRNLIHSEDFRIFSLEERRMLLGLNNVGGNWGLLGSMGRAATAKSTFLANERKSQKVRNRIFESLHRTLSSEDEETALQAGLKTFDLIMSEKGFGAGVTTRLLALARPDLFVSVNNMSKSGLTELFAPNLAPDSLGNRKNYERLLLSIHARPWHSTSFNSLGTALEREVWHMRAALVDAFVYGYG